MTVRKLGLTSKNILEIISSLSEKDYRKGPEPDENNHQQQIWVFKKEIDGTEIYIKLTISKIEGKEIAKCISFHETENR